MNFGARHVYMEGEAGAAGGGDGGAGAAAGAAGSGAGAAGGQPGAAAGAGAAAGGEGNPAGSALSGGNEWTPQSIPEKFRVNGADGELDLAASLRKVDEHRSALEKRMGSGDIRPKTADEYKLPDNETFKALQLDDATAKAFKEKAHGWGLSQSQYESVLNEWATLAPGLVSAGQAETVETAVAELKKTWGNDYDANIKASFSAAVKVGAAAGFTFDEVDKAIGNNPVAIRMFAALSKEMGEDATPAAANGGTGGGAQTAADFLTENFAAYSDPKDPKHKSVTERYSALLARETKGKNEPI